MEPIAWLVLTLFIGTEVYDHTMLDTHAAAPSAEVYTASAPDAHTNVFGTDNNATEVAQVKTYSLFDF